MKKTIKIVLTTILAFTFFIPNVNASKNLLAESGRWESFFNDWYASAGTIKSDSPSSYVIDVRSIGKYQWPSSDYGFGVQAKMFNKKIKLEKDKYYTFKSVLKSDKDRNIFIKITDVEKNPSTDAYEDTDNTMLEKWVTLKANQTYHLKETFLSTANTKRISLYYGIGYSGRDNALMHTANKIEATNISLIRDNLRPNKLTYTTIKNNSKDSKYTNYNIFGINEVEIVNFDNKENIRLNLDKDTATGIKINNETAELQKEGNYIYIPTIKLRNEYNDITVYSKSTYDAKEIILSKNIVNNTDVSNYKQQKIDGISKYENEKNSKTVNNIIKKAKKDIERANTKEETQRIYNEFRDRIRVQMVGEKNDKKIQKEIKNNNKNSNQKKTSKKTFTIINIIFYFITLLFGVVGLRLITKKA
ncbi:MAG: hypothetical protein IKG58_03725 [Bacilli bacterium]|nr:hypothetical protein [Bacilli bacterium]MBR3049645.1 hypothetical protein [Bacilli bacterium]